MANPLTADAVLAALTREGVKVRQYKDWRTHNRAGHGAWGPLNGVIIHHTVSSGTTNSVELCYNGHSELPGPLCHGVIDKEGYVWLVGWGRANHAGGGDGDVLQAVIDENYGEAPPPTDKHEGESGAVDGNARFYGFECINLGDGKDPWPAAQLDAIERASAALCRAHGWGAKSVIGHLEWSDWKSDPKGFTMPSMRKRIAERLTHDPSWNRGTTGEGDRLVANIEDVKVIFGTDNVIESPDFDKDPTGNKYWSAASYLRFAYLQDRNTSKAVDEIKKNVSALVAKPSFQLTDEQINQIAVKVASTPGLAEAIAQKVADLIAARMAN